MQVALHRQALQLFRRDVGRALGGGDVDDVLHARAHHGHGFERSCRPGPCSPVVATPRLTGDVLRASRDYLPSLDASIV